MLSSRGEGGGGGEALAYICSSESLSAAQCGILKGYLSIIISSDVPCKIKNKKRSVFNNLFSVCYSFRMNKRGLLADFDLGN